MVTEFFPEDFPRGPLIGICTLGIIYLGISAYCAISIFPQEKMRDYGLAETSYTNLYAGPIGGLRDLGGPAVFFSILGYLLASGVLFSLLGKALFATAWRSRMFFLFCSVVWWFVAGLITFGAGIGL
jgi:hypothetical protein